MSVIPTIFYCPYANCNASYNRKDRYETHLRSHTGERPFVCSHEGCGKSFTSSSHLQRHEDTHGPSFRCTVENCHYILKTKATLKKHIKLVHHKLKPKVYTCTDCDKEFKKRNALQAHELRHSGQLPHKCSVEGCEKEFPTPSKLKRHMKIHEGYPCKVPHCDKVFEKWTLYVQHMRDSHRPEYKCQDCSKVFAKLCNLKSHAQIHKEPDVVYPCQVPNCSRFYLAEKNLKWHMKKYHARRPFMCDKENCNRAFKTESDLAEHILYHGRRKPRKKKPKKPKPSLAAILSGFAEINQEDEKSDQTINENLEPDILPSRNLDLTDLEPNQLIENNISSCATPPQVQHLPNLFESSQFNTFSSNDDSIVQSPAEKVLSKECIKETIAEELDSTCLSKSHIIPKVFESNNSLKKLEELAIQEYTTIEVVGSENLSQVISVPVIKIDGQHWNKTVAIHIESIS